VSGEIGTVLLLAAIVLGGLLAVVGILLIGRFLRRARRTHRPERRSIRVIGVGGGGSNAVDRMIAARIPGVSFVAINTDAQALRRSNAPTKIRIGDTETRGLGSGGNPDVGRRSAEENEAKITRAVAGADLVFITAGLGGGTGSGAAPVVGADARLQGALTIAVVTKPFAFEGPQRRRIADLAMVELAKGVDAIIAIPNDRVADVVPPDTPMVHAFRVVDDVLLEVARGIIDVLHGPGLINLDFADVRTIVQDAGPTLIGLGRGTGQNRALDAARQAIASPLLEASIKGARGILFNVSGPPDLQLGEVRAAAEEIRANVDPDAYVIFGANFGRPADGEVLITLIATGLEWPEGTVVANRVAARKTAEAATVKRTDGATGPAKPVAVMVGGPPQEPKADSEPAPAQPVEAHARTDQVTSSGAPSGPTIDLDTPTFLRRKEAQAMPSERPAARDEVRTTPP
jgi:cell division protein FtsZ